MNKNILYIINLCSTYQDLKNNITSLPLKDKEEIDRVILFCGSKEINFTTDFLSKIMESSLSRTEILIYIKIRNLLKKEWKKRPVKKQYECTLGEINEIKNA